jgi:hypothetical protein
MGKRLFAIGCAIVVLGLSWMGWSQEEVQQTEAAAAKGRSLAERIASAGHGMLFDRQREAIEPDAPMVSAIQRAILGVILRDEKVKRLRRREPTLAGAAERLLRSGGLNVNERIVLRAAYIDRLLKNAPRKLKNKYAWRNDALISHHLNRHQGLLESVRTDVRRLLRRLGFFKPGPINTRYMADCRAHRVPIPPDWAEKGTPWVRQGMLDQNLLDPGKFAEVWTYSDPNVRGACIALPRDDGSPVKQPNGIICQSATTGHACFWDNKLRGVEPEQFLGWKGRRLVISRLKDGSDLQLSCTACHRGNNVFLIAPDDKTWAKVLRGPLTGPSTGTFTTRVEASSDNQGGHPRYIPITTLPERPGWENPFPSAPGCAGACHETHLLFPLPMPPACANPSVSNCYGTP